MSRRPAKGMFKGVGFEGVAIGTALDFERNQAWGACQSLGSFFDQLLPLGDLGLSARGIASAMHVVGSNREAGGSQLAAKGTLEDLGPLVGELEEARMKDPQFKETTFSFLDLVVAVGKGRNRVNAERIATMVAVTEGLTCDS